MIDARPSRQYPALLQLLRTAEALWNGSRRFFARWDLSPSQFNVLHLLWDQPEGRTQIELSRLLIMHRSNVTGLVDRLEARGLVRRRDNSRDRRAYLVVLSPAGRRLLGEILPEYYRAAEAVWEGLPAEKVEQMTKELEQLERNAGRIGKGEA